MPLSDKMFFILYSETLVFYVHFFHHIRNMDDFFVIPYLENIILIVHLFRSMFSL